MEGAHDEFDVWAYVADGEGFVEVGIESDRCTGCSGRSKRGSGGQNNTGGGHSLVVEGQTWSVSNKVKRWS
jgi:hypothetical protein